MSKPLKFAFFGGEPLSVPVLRELKNKGLVPTLIICNPDRPTGRNQELTPPPTKTWAISEGIEVFQPNTYKDDTAREVLTKSDWDVFVVVAYNFILPDWLLNIPRRGVINVHPSMLPKLRGASPIRTAILNDLRDDIGVTIMLLDSEMDHGPILEQMHMPIADDNWPVSGPELDKDLAQIGGKLLADTLPAWVDDELLPQEQDHAAASYCHKLQKSDGELDLNPLKLPVGQPGKKAWHAINAFAGIGDTFFIHNNKRIKIKKAEFVGGSLRLLRVIPEGKKEIDFKDYIQSLGS